MNLRTFFAGKRAEQDLDDELKFHLDMETRKNIAAGMSPEQAARAARLQFGTDPAAVKDYVRDTRRLGFFETLVQDIRYALRGFRRTPLFALTVIGTIAIGLGWNTAAFTIFNAFLLHPIDARDPYSLYAIGWQNRSGEGTSLTWSLLDELRKERPGLAGITAMFSLRTRMDGRFATCTLVDGEYFQMLGVNPVVGRWILPQDDQAAESSPAVVLSYTAWQNRFHLDPDVVGRKVLIQGRPFTVAGVMPREFTGFGHAYPDLWMSLANLAAFSAPGSAGDTSSGAGPGSPTPVNMAGRLQPGESVEQAQSVLSTWMQERLPTQAPRATLMSLATLVPLNRRYLGGFMSVGIVFFLVLLSACANVANLMLARAMSRQREIGIRLSLGAARGRLIRQLLTESVLLSIPAAALAFAVSQTFIAAGLRVVFDTIPAAFVDQANYPELSPDVHVFWFMIGAAIAVALMFGLVPALQATRMNVMQAARGDFSIEFRPARLRSALVIAQVTVCGFLLICSAVFLRRANHLERLDPGVRTRDVVEIYVQPKSRPSALAALRSQTDVEFLAASSDTPFDSSLSTVSVSGAGEAGQLSIPYRFASPEYFQTLEIPMVRGRTFASDEGSTEAGVVVVSESAARKLWPHQDAIGQSLTLPATADPRHGVRPPPHRTVQVIGIARDSAVGALDNVGRSCLFFPSNVADPRNNLLVRVHGEVHTAQQALNAALEAADPGSVQDIHLLQDFLDAAIWSDRLEFWISEALGVIAVLLTISGIYAVLSYVVAQRTKEIGIRMAMGAGTGVVSRLVLGQCLRLAGIGIAIGVVLALATARVISAISADVSAQVFDTVAYAGGIAVVLSACLAAAFFPARRAARVDPITTLRYD